MYVYTYVHVATIITTNFLISDPLTTVDHTTPNRKKEISLVWDHFKKTKDAGRAHPEYLEAEKVAPSTSLERFLKTDLTYKNGSRKKKRSWTRRMIALDVQPFSIVEDMGFCDLIRKLDPSKTDLRNVVLPREYEGLSYGDNVSITTDCWPSRANKTNLLTNAMNLNQQFCRRKNL